MAIWARLKSIAGGGGATPTVASATTIILPENDNVFLVSGSTTITTITVAAPQRNRLVWFIGAASASVSFTNDNSPSTGEMYLQGADRVIQEDDVLCLYCKTDGTWLLVSSTAA